MYWSDYAETSILNAFRGQTVTAPTTIFAAAFLSNPTDLGTGTEISYPGYIRQPITFSAPTAGSAGVSMVNDADVNFPVSTTAAGNVTYFGFFDNITGGNLWCYVKVEGDTLTVDAGVAPLIKAGKLSFVFRGTISEVMKTRALNLLRGVNLAGFNSYVALYDGNPENGGFELSGGNYARFGVSFSAPTSLSTGQTMIGNSTAVSSNSADTNWGTWSYTAIMDAASGGSPVAYNPKTPVQVMGETRSVTIQEANKLTVLLA